MESYNDGRLDTNKENKMKQIEIDQECQFIEDCTTNPKIAMWNLITSKGAVKLWTKGIKPSRHWRFKDVKTYFGMNGNAETMLYKLEKLHETLTTKKENK